MENNLIRRNITRKRRTLRVRKNLRGTSTKPRLCISKTKSHIFAQLIDDENMLTIAGMGTMSKEFKDKKSKESAKKLGKKISEIAKEKKIERVVFDRGSNKYHGIIAELANAAREAGLQF